MTPSQAVTGSTANALPYTPSDLAVDATTASQVDLSWSINSLSEHDGFIIERSLDEETFTALSTAIDADTTTVSVDALAASTTYFFRVKAYNGAGDSAYSNVIEVMTTDRAPAGLTVVAESTTTSEIQLLWDPMPTLDRFNAYLSRNRPAHAHLPIRRGIPIWISIRPPATTSMCLTTLQRCHK